MHNSISDTFSNRTHATFGLLLAYLAFSPLIGYLGFPISLAAIPLMDWQRILELVTIAAAILILALNGPTAWPKGLSLQDAMLWTLFFGFGLLSSLFSAMPMVALLDWSWHFCWLAATALLILQLPSQNQNLHRTLSIWTITALVSYTMIFFTANAAVLTGNLVHTSIYFPGFTNVRAFTDYQTAILFLIPAAIRYLDISKNFQRSCWVVAGLYVSIALATGSRSLILGQIVGLATFFLLVQKKRNFFLAGQLSLWSLGALFYVLIFVALPWLTGNAPVPIADSNNFLRFSASGREIIWGIAWEMFLNHPLLGSGPMHFAVTINSIAASPHNHLIQLIGEWGAPATVLFLLMTGKFLFWSSHAIVHDCSSAPDLDHDFRVLAFAGLMAMLAQSLVSPVFNNPASQILLSVMAVVARPTSPSTDAGHAAAQLLRQRVMAFTSLVALVAAIGFVVPWVARLAERNKCYVEYELTHNTSTSILVSPRFWQQGWIYPPCDLNSTGRLRAAW